MAAAAGQWSVKVIEPSTGAVVASMPDATVAQVSDTLNKGITATVSAPVLDPALGELISPDGTTLRELRIDRDGTFFGRYIPIRVDADAKACHIEAADPVLWPLTKKHVGRLHDLNRLVNGDFEATPDLTGWTVDGGIDSATAQVSVNAMSGTKVARLETSSPSINTSRMYQAIPLPASATIDDWVVTAYSWVEPIAGFVPFDPYLLGLVALVWDGSQYVTGAIAGGGLDENESRTFWTRKRVAVRVPSHVGAWEIHVFAMSPGGVVYWDYARAIKVERLEYLGVDQAAIVEALVAHAQDTSIGKVDLGITADCAPTGVARAVTYSYAEHQVIFDAIADLARQRDGFDFSSACTETTKTIRTHYPQRGSDTPAITLRWGDNIAADGLGWTFSVTEAASAIAVIGDGSTDERGQGDDREHVYAFDADALGGRMLEATESKLAGPYVTISQMREQASELLAARKAPVAYTLKSHRHVGSDYADMLQAGTLQAGDRVRVVVDHGVIQINETARIVGWTLDPATEQVEFKVVSA